MALKFIEKRYMKAFLEREFIKFLLSAGFKSYGTRLWNEMENRYDVNALTGRIDHNAEKPNVLLVTHDATYTGAPILAANISKELCSRYNVMVICARAGGALSDALLDVSSLVMVPTRPPESCEEYKQFFHCSLERYNISFAIVNSIESRGVLPHLKEANIPTVTLVHEFAVGPKDMFRDAISLSDHVVFSTNLTLESAIDVADIEVRDKLHIIPQGKCNVPVSSITKRDEERDRVRSRLLPLRRQDDFLVIGVGTVCFRKGIDLFIEVARQTLRDVDAKTVNFAWIGDGYNPDNDASYSGYLQDQLRRAKLEKYVTMLPATAEIEHVYEISDALLLTSRLDPLPNVAIDAMSRGLPVLCFDQASGISEILQDRGLRDACVADYMDTAHMSKILLNLVKHENVYAGVSKTVRNISNELFNMKHYVSQIESFAVDAGQKRRNNERKARERNEPIDLA